MQPVAGFRSIVPKLPRTARVACCVMLHEFEARIGPEWLDVVERLLETFGLKPSDASATLATQKTRGEYKRVRKRLATFLSESDDSKPRPNVIVNAGSRIERESFCPYQARVVLNLAHPRLVSAVIAIDKSLAQSFDALERECEHAILPLAGAFYGCAWDFPFELGPDCYLASVIARPQSVAAESLWEYGERLTRWRDRRWNGYSSLSGYFREIYPINLVRSIHLSTPIVGMTVEALMKSTGELRRIESCVDTYRWVIDADQLDGVRAQLEHSGLVLSSATDPASLKQGGRVLSGSVPAR